MIQSTLSGMPNRVLSSNLCENPYGKCETIEGFIGSSSKEKMGQVAKFSYHVASRFRLPLYIWIYEYNFKINVNITSSPVTLDKYF